MRLTPPLLALTLVAGAAFALARPAGVDAHARYESSSPGMGEILAVGPDEVEIVFSNDIQRIAGKYDIQVNKDRGPLVNAGPAVVNDEDRTKMSVPIQADLADGRYVVHWNNVSDEDGDPAEGAFSFYINYEPNTVDLENDRQLELIGAEESPASDGTPTPSETTSAQTPSANESPATTSAASPTAVAGGADDDDGGGAASVILIVVGAIALAAVLVGGGYLFLRGRGA